jgi:hypothetical protein
MTETRPPTDWRIVGLLGKQRYLTLSLLAFLCVLPLAHDEPGLRLITQFVLALVFITGPLSVARTRLTLRITGIFAALVFLLGLGSILIGAEWFARASAVLGFAFFGFLAWLVTRELLFDVSEVTSETLWAAVNVYVLIGLSFAFLYSVVTLFSADAFVGKFMEEDLRDQMLGFVYFSFVTLTTLGYGDITPNNTVVGTLTYLEALVGQLYVAIMIARLVGLYIARAER